VITRVGIPSVWESTAAKYLVARMVVRIVRAGRGPPRVWVTRHAPGVWRVRPYSVDQPLCDLIQLSRTV
jgi:hypothetical protein